MVSILGPQPAVLYWGWSSTSKNTCGKSNKTNLEASARVKHIKREIRGNDRVCSFSPDKKHFLVPSLKSNTPGKLLSCCALCNLGLLVPTTLILFLTGLFLLEEINLACRSYTSATVTEMLQCVHLSGIKLGWNQKQQDARCSP